MKVCAILKRRKIEGRRRRAAGGAGSPASIARSTWACGTSIRAGRRVWTGRWMSLSFMTCAAVGVVRLVGR